MDISPKRASTSALLLFLLANIVLLTFVNYGFSIGWFGWLEAPTNELIQATLLASLLLGLVVVGGIIFAYARLAPADVGLGWRQLRAGLVYTLILWALTQVICGLADVITTGGLQINTNWAEAGASFMIGALLAQVCGNALVEEIGWRGFLLPQVFLRLGGNDGPEPRQNLVLAVLGVQFLFALMHIPNRLLSNNMLISEMLVSLVFVFILGIFFACIYLRTGNLFLAIGIHALFNTPTALFAPVLPSQAILGALVILALVAWPRLTTHRTRKLGTPIRIGAT
jgi:membrane protease YdiL (CAAX protease family)